MLLAQTLLCTVLELPQGVRNRPLDVKDPVKKDGPESLTDSLDPRGRGRGPQQDDDDDEQTQGDLIDHDAAALIALWRVSLVMRARLGRDSRAGGSKMDPRKASLASSSSVVTASNQPSNHLGCQGERGARQKKIKLTQKSVEQFSCSHFMHATLYNVMMK